MAETQPAGGVVSRQRPLNADSLPPRLATGLAAILPGLMLAAVVFPGQVWPGDIDPQILTNPALLYVPFASAMSLASIFCWTFYRIDAGAHERAPMSIRQAAAAAETARETGLETSPDGGRPIAPPALAPRGANS